MSAITATLARSSLRPSRNMKKELKYAEEDDVKEDDDDDDDWDDDEESPVDELIRLEKVKAKEKKLAKLFSELYPAGKRVLLWADSNALVNCHVEGEQEPSVILIWLVFWLFYFVFSTTWASCVAWHNF